MTKLACITLLIASLAGCATRDADTSSAYGNFVQNSPAACDQKMAEDAVKRLVAMYPPARTRFDLQQSTSDAFGTALVASMRGKGYALLEYKPAPGSQDLATANGQRPVPAKAPAAGAIAKPAAATLSLRYILDLDQGSNLYRVTLLVGNQTLTRAYLAQNGSALPAGAWIRKE